MSYRRRDVTGMRNEIQRYDAHAAWRMLYQQYAADLPIIASAAVDILTGEHL